jgi:hypothetical protein
MNSNETEKANDYLAEMINNHTEELKQWLQEKMFIVFTQGWINCEEMYEARAKAFMVNKKEVTSETHTTAN